MEPYWNYVYIAGGVAAGLVILLALLKILFRRKPIAEVHDPQLHLDLESLGEAGPGENCTPVEFYNVPMRLAAVVIAPSGRGSKLPPEPSWPTMLDAMVPGMADVLATHKPQFHRWPSQLSTSGFARKFFSGVALPGNKGKGTPWCMVAGRCESDFDPVLVGMIFRSDRANNLGQFELERATKWLDVLRVRAG